MNPEAARGPLPRLGARLLLLAGGVLLALLLAEGFLQGLKAWIGPGRMPDSRPTPHPGRKTVLCLGDSHTYGLKVQRELQSYPARLAFRLNGGDSDGDFVVLNLGMPGSNTALVADQLERALAGQHFDLVLVLAGYNDEWNLTEPAAADAGATGADSTGGAGRHLLLPQLLRWLWFCLHPERPALDQLGQDGKGMYIERPDGTRQYINDLPENRPGLKTGGTLAQAVEQRLLSMVASCKASGVPILLQTYACRFNDVFEAASAGARLAAQKGGVPLIDHAAWFEAQAKGVDPKVLFQEDGHPTGTGYDLMARAIHAKLQELKRDDVAPFADWKLPPESATAGGSAAGGTNGETGGDLRVDPATLSCERDASAPAGFLRFRLRGPPGRAWQLAFAHARAPPSSTSVLELALDPLFQESRTADGLSGRFDEQGEALAWTARTLFGSDPAAPVLAQLLVIDPFATSPAGIFVAGAPPQVVDASR